MHCSSSLRQERDIMTIQDYLSYDTKSTKRLVSGGTATIKKREGRQLKAGGLIEYAGSKKTGGYRVKESTVEAPAAESEKRTDI